MRASSALAIGLIIGTIVSLAIGYVILPRHAVLPRGVDTTTLEEQISQLQGQVSTLQSQIEEKDNQIATLKSHIEELEKLVPPLAKGEWNLINTFDGSAYETTELFYIPSGQWRINWAYTGGKLALFSFFVYPEGEKYPEGLFVEFLSADGPSKSDTTNIYTGPGNFYIKLLAANIEQWTLTIEAFVPK